VCLNILINRRVRHHKKSSQKRSEAKTEYSKNIGIGQSFVSIRQIKLIAKILTLILVRLWSVGLWRAETAAVVLSLAGVLLWLLITTLLLVAFVVVAASLVGSLRARLCIAIGLLGPERILVSAGGRRVAVLLFVEKAWFGSLESDRVLGS